MSFLTDAANEVEGLKDKVDDFAKKVEDSLDINNIVKSAFQGLLGGGSFMGITADGLSQTVAQSIPSGVTQVLDFLQWMVKTIQAVLDTLLSLAEAILRIAGAILDAVDAVVSFFSSW